MAKSRGRPFRRGQSGNPRGRPQGAKDAVPRSFKASIKAMYEKLATEHPELFENAITRDLKMKRGTAAFHHVQLAAHYLDGKPADTVKLGNDDGPLLVIVGNDGDDA
jgi:hypothetical protein